MKRNSICLGLLCFLGIIAFSRCTSNASEEKPTTVVPPKSEFEGYKSQEEYGKHLVMIGGCNDCHTPKIMTPMGPAPDTTLTLSGHPAQMPPPDVNRLEMEKKGLAVTSTLTAWVGPWGISYAANLTSDATGLGNWDEATFMRTIREGKFKGIATGRSLLPPMPWQEYRNMTDPELKAIFAYLKSTKPIKNVVPDMQPPVSPPPPAAPHS